MSEPERILPWPADWKGWRFIRAYEQSELQRALSLTPCRLCGAPTGAYCAAVNGTKARNPHGVRVRDGFRLASTTGAAKAQAGPGDSGK